MVRRPATRSRRRGRAERSGTRHPSRRRSCRLRSSRRGRRPGSRNDLQDRFGCPVFDLYAMNEAGMIAADSGDGFRIVPHDLYVEIVSPGGEPCEPGTRGEIFLTGGNNPMMPLLRYGTGDQAAMEFDAAGPRLIGFEPRTPVLFQGLNGREVASHEVTAAL